MVRPAVLTACAALALCGLSGCSENKQPAAPTEAPTSASPSRTHRVTTPPPVPKPAVSRSPQPPTVDVNCHPIGDYTSRIYKIQVSDSGPDFTAPWSDGPLRCEGDQRFGGELTTLEQAVLAASGYESAGSLPTLYGMCASTDPDDSYVTMEILSDPQVAELTAALLLCPSHPQAPEFQATLDRTAQVGGRDFYGGVQVVGVDIEAGTYVVKDVENCYWERQAADGSTIANDFKIAAARVEVTVLPSDYAFFSEGCGQWLPK